MTLSVSLPVEDINGVPHYRLSGLHYTRRSCAVNIIDNGFHNHSGAYGVGVYATYPDAGESYTYYRDNWIGASRRVELAITALVPVADILIIADPETYGQEYEKSHGAEAVYVAPAVCGCVDMDGQFRVKAKHIVSVEVSRDRWPEDNNPF